MQSDRLFETSLLRFWMMLNGIRSRFRIPLDLACTDNVTSILQWEMHLMCL